MQLVVEKVGFVMLVLVTGNVEADELCWIVVHVWRFDCLLDGVTALTTLEVKPSISCCFVMAALSRCSSISSQSSLSFLSLVTRCWYSATCRNASSSSARQAASSLVCWSLSSASFSFRSASWILARADNTLEC